MVECACWNDWVHTGAAERGRTRSVTIMPHEAQLRRCTLQNKQHNEHQMTQDLHSVPRWLQSLPSGRSRPAWCTGHASLPLAGRRGPASCSILVVCGCVGHWVSKGGSKRWRGYHLQWCLLRLSSTSAAHCNTPGRTALDTGTHPAGLAPDTHRTCTGYLGGCSPCPFPTSCASRLPYPYPTLSST